MGEIGTVSDRRTPSSALPTREQIAVIATAEAVCGLMDAVEKSIDHIEAQLEFEIGNDEWSRAAINALALHRYSHRLLSRRLKQIRQRGTAPRPEDANHELTNMALRDPPFPNASALKTVEAVDTEISSLAQIIDALTVDREDELAEEPGNRDQVFLASIGSVIRKLRGARQELQVRRGVIGKAQRMGEAAAHNASRERDFVDAARAILDRDTFLRIWAAVDRLNPNEAEAA